MENNVVIYQSSDGLVKMEAIVDASNETIWATQNISYHFKRIFASGELDAQTVIKEILITAQSGVRGVSEEKIKYYNLDAIQSLKEKFKESPLFGVEKDKSFHSSIGQIYQTWDAQELYPSVEEKAAMLLYLVALTLLIAESRMDEMDILVKVVVNLINRKQ